MSKSTLGLFDLPRIDSLEDLSNQIRLSKGLLFHLATSADSYYKQVSITKPTGGERILSCPHKKMKAVQGWILKNILYRMQVHSAAQAYVPGKSLRDNAEAHKNNRYVLIMDIEDFFGSIPYRNVWTVFHAHGYSKHVSHILASLCTYHGSLPQGGVTSPALSNIVCRRLDKRLSALVSCRDLTYTRYADDITISGNEVRQLRILQDRVREILAGEGFRVNDRKTKLLGPSRARTITGLIVGDTGDVGIGRRRLRAIRSLIHHTLSTPAGVDISANLRQLHGSLGFVKGVDSKAFAILGNYYALLLEKKAQTEAAATGEGNSETLLP